MTAIFVLDVPENAGVVQVAEEDAVLQVEKVGPYYRIALDDGDRPPADPGEDVGPGHTSTADQIVIDRRSTGCRHAVWYSALAGLQHARVVQHDKNALRVARR